MLLLSELLRDVYRLDPDEDTPKPNAGDIDEIGGTAEELELDPDGVLPADQQPDDTDALDLDDPSVEDPPRDPDRVGLIRTVPGAHLVYKRESPDGGFEELWAYNITDLRQNQETKHQILAGTDIPRNRSRSPDGAQSYEVWAAGNVEMLAIRGLPN